MACRRRCDRQLVDGKLSFFKAPTAARRAACASSGVPVQLLAQEAHPVTPEQARTVQADCQPGKEQVQHMRVVRIERLQQFSGMHGTGTPNIPATPQPACVAGVERVRDCKAIAVISGPSTPSQYCKQAHHLQKSALASATLQTAARRLKGRVGKTSNDELHHV